ncbi:unnamed protein product [Hermetia illucens]|uniref:Uncharacterized protein n=1 Tax=Hermetia illucens TaxID=343691 RepID=A0A7R8YLT3_HERIL|nr:endocuticle structural glycoprotein SgAbd-2-like [Hermetia illucens]CAD7076722.1 unnamed protein product [Hermetia illucens]
MFSKLLVVASFVAFAASLQAPNSAFLPPFSQIPVARRQIQFLPQPTLRPYAPVPTPIAYRQTGEASARILKQDSDISPDGSYQYAYETENGISAQESGVPKSLGGNPPEIAEQVQGAFSYTSPEGEHVVLQYAANENGFQPSGSHIPTPPPIPEAIARSLQFLQANGRL